MLAHTSVITTSASFIASFGSFTIVKLKLLALDISKMCLVNNGKRTYYAIGGGMLYFSDNVATILVDSIESQEEIDLSRAEAAKERASKRLESKDENIDMKRAEIALKKAINRISVKGL